MRQRVSNIRAVVRQPYRPAFWRARRLFSNIRAMPRQPYQPAVATNAVRGVAWATELWKIIRGSITPVMVGEARLAHELSRALFEEGVLATGIGYPTVPQGKARVRTIVAATHTRDQLDRALEAFERAGKRLGILQA